MPQGMRPDLLGQPGAAGDPADDPPGTVPVQPFLRCGEEDRSLGAFADRQVDGAGSAGGEVDDSFLAALASSREGAVAAFGAERFDVGAGGLGHRSPLRVSREMSACSAGLPSPAATRRAPTSLRSRPVAWD